MSIIQFKETNCKHCYKCVRKCPIKSIKISDEQAQIVERECVLCGQCFLVCPQNAKRVKSDVKNIKAEIQRGEEVYVSLAPSYAAAFDGISFTAMSKALKDLGFKGVEETAIGAGKVTEQYEKLLKSGQMKNLITTCCPTVNLLVEQYYPELLPYMAPVASPAVVHSQLLKKVHGKQHQVVFIGPCISKKYEAEKNTSIDGVILFDELHQWLYEKESLVDEEVEEIHNVINRLYPIPGGILQTMSPDSKEGYSEVVIDGMESCIKILEELKTDLLGENNIQGQLIEMSACAGSCLYGPGLKDCNMPLLRARENVCEASRKKTVTPMPTTEQTKIDCSATLHNLKIDENAPTEDEIDVILKSMGKLDESHIYDCGACGYDTCKEKAVAVWQGKAEIKMCVPYMWNKMESFSNLVFDNSPNAIVLANENFSIVEYNNAAITMFDLYRFDHQGLPLVMLFDSNALENEVKKGKSFYNEIQFVKDINKTIDITLVRGKSGADYILFVRDISEDILHKEKIESMRAETLETAQRVIDKQMRVAQEIASLLGETTGETKIALRDLKKSISSTK